MAQYDVDALSTALEFDTTDARQKSIGRLPGLDRVVIAWLNGTNPLVQAFNVNTSTGALTAIGTPLDIGTAGSASDGISLGVINASNLIVFWNGTGGDGFTILLSVDGTGNITANGTELEYDTSNGTFPVCMVLDSTHVLNVWQGASNGGRAQVFGVDTGTPSITPIGTAFTINFGSGNITIGNNNSALVQLNSTKVFFSWVNVDDDGYAGVLSINTSTWAITAAGAENEYLDTAAVDGVSAIALDVISSPMIVINGWANTGTLKPYVQTFSINTSTWAITPLDSPLILADPATVQAESISLQVVDTTHFLAFYEGAGSNGFAGVITYDPGTGELTPTASATEFDTSIFRTTATVAFGDVPGFYVAAWQGASDDGFVQAFQVEGEPIGPANLKTLDTNIKSNIKSYNGNLIANVKSLNTNT